MSALAVADSWQIVPRGFATHKPVGSLLTNARMGHGCQIMPEVSVALRGAHALTAVMKEDCQAIDPYIACRDRWQRSPAVKHQ